MAKRENIEALGDLAERESIEAFGALGTYRRDKALGAWVVENVSKGAGVEGLWDFTKKENLGAAGD